MEAKDITKEFDEQVHEQVANPIKENLDEN